MPTLRLFAAAREAAGRSVDELPGATVDEVLRAARARYGETFGEVLATSGLWVNGEPASGDTSVGEADEVAVLPPVSGGMVPGDTVAGDTVAGDTVAGGTVSGGSAAGGAVSGGSGLR